MKPCNCTCGKQPELEQWQLFIVFRCDDCDKQVSSLHHATAVKKWNELNAPVKYKNMGVTV